MAGISSIFNRTLQDEEPHVEAIKWQLNNSKYEIHVAVLRSLDYHDLVPHCLNVHSKVDMAVTTLAHKGPSLYTVFPRTLSIALRAAWDRINIDADSNPLVDNTHTPDHFDDRIREFIAVHCTPEDRYELINEIRNGIKPREVGVQTYWYTLCEWNEYIPWMPGNEPPLTDAQEK